MICQLPGCEESVPEGRRKYCSNNCAKEGNRIKTRETKEKKRVLEALGAEVGQRTCLSCDKPFLSEGPWNRICPRCEEGNSSTPPRAIPVSRGYSKQSSSIDDYNS